MTFRTPESLHLIHCSDFPIRGFQSACLTLEHLKIFLNNIYGFNLVLCKNLELKNVALFNKI